MELPDNSKKKKGKLRSSKCSSQLLSPFCYPWLLAPMQPQLHLDKIRRPLSMLMALKGAQGFRTFPSKFKVLLSVNVARTRVAFRV